jgi:chromosome segregation ATPase
MDTKNWIEALGLAQQYPLLYVVGGVIFCAGAGVAWLVRGQSASGEIKALERHLDWAREKLKAVQSDLDRTERKLDSTLEKVAAQEREITGLRERRGVETVAVDRLTKSNTAIRDDLSSLSTSTSVLSNDLMLVV